MEENKKTSPLRIVTGGIILCLFIITCLYQITGIDLLKLSEISFLDNEALNLITIIELAAALLLLLPAKKVVLPEIQVPKDKRKLTKRTAMASLFILLAVPLTIFIGIYCLKDRKYYFISLLIILETMIPFFMMFEQRKPQARELIIISVICAIAVSGRAIFYMLPQFKPVIAIIIIAAVCFGGETGFLVGVVTGFVSNFFFGQGPWTPWQMFAFGIIGFVAGILFKKGILRKTKVSLCIFGGLATLILYGGIMNPSSVLMWQPNPTFNELFIMSMISGFRFDLIHAVSTVFFLWFLSEPMIDKLERIKVKYGLL